jgi:hypothetical protein
MGESSRIESPYSGSWLGTLSAEVVSPAAGTVPGPASDPIEGRGGHVPVCLVNPTSLAFGSVIIGETKDLSFRITNTGGGTLIGTVSETHAEYSIVGDATYSLGADESKIFTVRFSPVAPAGTKTCTVTTGCTSNVNCTGTAVAAGLTISNVSFSVLTDRIQTMFTTSETAACTIAGALYDAEFPEEMLFEMWYQNIVEHGPSHSHVKTGLATSTLYAIRIWAGKGGSQAWAPSETGYYVVQTNPNGGLKFII